MSALARRRLELLLSSRFSSRSQNRDALPHMRWTEPVEWGLGSLQTNLNRSAYSEGLENLLNWTGRSTRTLLASRLASERGMVLHITLSPDWAKERYLDLMGRSGSRLADPGPDMSYSSFSNTRFRSIRRAKMRQVEPLWAHGPMPRGDVLFTSLVGATCDKDDLSGLTFSELVIDHLALSVLHKNDSLWGINKTSRLPQFHQVYAQGEQERSLRDSLGRTWAPGEPFLVPGLPRVGLISDTIRLFDIVIGLVALYDGATVPLCPAACDLLVPVPADRREEME